MQPGLTLSEWEAVKSHRFASSSLVSARIASSATRGGGQLAVVDGVTRLTYAELVGRADRLASYLRACGARREQVVGLLLERSADFVVAALAVMRAGAAYLPIDPSTPAERVRFILGDANAALLLTHRGKASEMPGGAWQTVDLDAEMARWTAQPIARLDEPEAESLAYVIYTSGSTGSPKGVEITHANLAHLIAWHNEAFGVTTADRAGQTAGLGFDAAVWEIWPHLAAGACLHIADEGTRRSPQRLRDWICSEKITICFVPTALVEQMLQLDWSAAALRTLLTGADRLRRRPPEGLPFQLVNNYGPTECTVVATSGVVVPGSEQDEPSIGKPIPCADALVLDDRGQPVAAGEAGELYIGGALVGRGYRNNPALTQERFVLFAQGAELPRRLYRTGDRVRLLENGELAFLGRLDSQVKLLGYRIEPGEIEGVLGRHGEVTTSAVVARDAVGGMQLVAYVVARDGAKLTEAQLRDHLAKSLPEYMIPARFVVLAALPLTASGKLDRAALASLPLGDPEEGGKGTNKEEDRQQQIAGLVASLLGQPSVDPSANFFLLGGHSMMGVQLAAKIKDLFGVKVGLRQLFGAPTVVALSAEVARLSKLHS